MTTSPAQVQPPPHQALRGQTAIISGGLGDIGREIALEFARRGADIAVGDLLDHSQSETLLEQIREIGRRGRYDRVDVAQAQQVQEWVAAVEGDLGLPSLIVPNAAVVHFASLPHLTPVDWRQEMSVNLDGAFYLAHAATARLLAHRCPGRVVFIGSWAAHAVHTTIPSYCVSKAGLRMLCRCMAAELAPHDILVNELAPGYVHAGLSGRYYREHPGSAEADRRTVPVQRLIEAREVAIQVAWLCDPANRHMAGTTVLMDGGLSLFGVGGLSLQTE